ncbi:autophagy-related protein 13 homolog [Galleria mellonella]|uniref:Autophagy-related protein 13 n=1 Tax=Galleria mellonella TaxID=7137 RepID=A0A6J1X2X3_GALME|nr:autophagy-related protein 13 homolog [Galleria mellonella]XP_052749424.1 autophagy-related protein 13 homolog [Galleria mellonella]XP_052749425.1 autophagy-related protein 13 homolog [Galleria mellonella]
MAQNAASSSINGKNEFTKLIKFLAYKGVQVIVESRKGVKLEPNSKPISSDSGWFNLQIPDSPEVNQATKNALPSDQVLETIQSRLHVEISVQTEDGDEIVLELWTFHLDEADFDMSLKAINAIYIRMGILLKSLITITRMSPVYHLSRVQRSEPFTIFYRVYNGKSNVKALGTSVKKMQTAMLKTPLGGIYFKVEYIANFSIIPNKCQYTGTLLLKSDHFELSAKNILLESNKKKEYKGKEKKPARPIDLNKPLRHAAFVDEILLERTVKDFLTRISVPNRRPQLRRKSPPKEEAVESKSTQDLDIAVVSNSPTSLEMPPKKFSGIRGENEPPLKLLCIPFADNHPIRELAEFYKDIFNAPHLKLADDLIRSKSKSAESIEKELEEANEDLAEDLKIYENSAIEFDKLVADMCQSAECIQLD